MEPSLIIDSFSEEEKHELMRGGKILHIIFRNGPILGNAYNLLIDEIVDKRKPKPIPKMGECPRCDGSFMHAPDCPLFPARK